MSSTDIKRPMKSWRFYRHMPVYLRNGRRLGRTEEIGHGVEHLHVQQGIVLVRDWYIPMSAVADVTPRGAWLTADLADLRRNRWHVPPEDYLARQGATPGYQYTRSAEVPEHEIPAEPGPENVSGENLNE